MFRAALISILLTLPVGQDASLLCKVWCEFEDPNVAAPCHAIGAPVRAAGVASGQCDAGGAVAFLREEGGKRLLDLSNHEAIVSRFDVESPSATTLLSTSSADAPAFVHTPLSTPLRI
jgi:hypothetical protein